ncbi:MAG: hypothetical protein LBW77_04595, partial [Verrucomicrobiota bacterium]|nr:hypothetical protein [Verrucomicrobiota bacterium]
VWFPPGLVTVCKNLVYTPGNSSQRLVVRDGTLRVTDSFAANCTRFTILGEGIIFPPGFSPAPTLWDIRTASRFEIDANATFTLGINAYSNTYPYAQTFAGGTLAVTQNASFRPGGLVLENSALTVADGKTLDAGTLAGASVVTLGAGATLTAAALSGATTVTLGAGATLAITDLYGFDGTIVNNGGTVLAANTRTLTIPAGPAGEPAFWVDASQSGSFQTNAQGKLVWLDTRTARDGASGLMYATALTNSLPPVLQNALNGLPVVDFGPIGSSATEQRGMVWSQRLTNVQAVHWVIGAQNGGGQLLGDTANAIDWFRYSDSSSNPMPNFRYGDAGNDYRTPILPSPGRWENRDGRMNYIHNGTAYLNGVQTEGLGISNGYPNAGYHLLSIRTTGPTCAGAFASERVMTGQNWGHRSGAQRLGEVLVYGVPLTAEQNRANDAYLSWKWFARRLNGYRVAGEDLIVLSGSGTARGETVLVRELAPASAGLSVDGDLILDHAPAAAEIGAVIRLAQLPAPGVAAVSVSGDAFLPPRVTLVLGEVRAGVFTVLAAGGALHGEPEWLIDTSAAPHAAGGQCKVAVQDDAVVLTISAKGTLLMLK